MRQRRGIPGAEQPEPVVEPLRDLGHGKRAHARGGQLDGERHAVKAATDLRDGIGVGDLGLERRVRGPGAVHEELDRVRARQRFHPIGGFARHMQRFAARRQHAQLGVGLQQVARRVGAAAQQVLAIVDDQQQPPSRQAALELGLLHPERGGDRESHQTLVLVRGELHAPHARGKIAQHGLGHAQRKAGLARAPRAGERHQARAPQQVADLRDLGLASHEPVELGRQVVQGTVAGRGAILR